MTEDERPKFERFAKLMDLRLTRKGVGYASPKTASAWAAWQARAFLQPKT